MAFICILFIESDVWFYDVVVYPYSKIGLSKCFIGSCSFELKFVQKHYFAVLYVQSMTAPLIVAAFILDINEIWLVIYENTIETWVNWWRTNCFIFSAIHLEKKYQTGYHFYDIHVKSSGNWWIDTRISLQFNKCFVFEMKFYNLPIIEIIEWMIFEHKWMKLEPRPVSMIKVLARVLVSFNGKSFAQFTLCSLFDRLIERLDLCCF